MVGNGVDFSSEVEAFVTCQHYFACKVSDKMGCEPLSQGRYKKNYSSELDDQGGGPSFLVKL